MWPFSAAVLLSSCLDDSSNRRLDSPLASQYVTGSIPVSQQPPYQLCPYGNGSSPARLQHPMCCSPHTSLRECQSPSAQLCSAFCLCNALQQPYRWVTATFDGLYTVCLDSHISGVHFKCVRLWHACMSQLLGGVRSPREPSYMNCRHLSSNNNKSFSFNFINFCWLTWFSTKLHTSNVLSVVSWAPHKRYDAGHHYLG